jgi:hypothetical protein
LKKKDPIFELEEPIKESTNTNKLTASQKNIDKSHLSFPDLSEVHKLEDPKSKMLQEFLFNNPFQESYAPPEVDIDMIRNLGKVNSLDKNPKNAKYYLVSYANGTSYNGTIVEDKDDVFYGQPIGTGKLLFVNGDVYEGDLGNRVKGKYIYKDGTCYEGQFYKYSKSGVGVETYEDGTVYKGHFKTNLKHGIGEYQYVNGDVFKGKFINGKRNGLGTYVFASGENVYGDWKNDKLHGKGRWKGLSGEVVERSFVQSHVSL